MGNLVVKSNAFVGASYGLGTTEQRLLLLAILKARETDNIAEVIGKRLTIHASEYMQVFDVDRTTAYESLENAVNGLYESEYRYIETLPTGEMKTHKYRFVSSISYSNGLGQVEFTFTPETVPLVVGLSENFTKYEIEQVAKLSSQYALRLYELLARWRSKGTFEIKLTELRFKFGLIDNEYPRMDNFKRWVLDAAINEINKHTDLTVSYEQHKQGRIIIGFTFTIKQKAQKTAKITKPKNTEKDTKTVDMFDNLTDIERQTIQERIDEYIQELETNKGKVVSDFQRKNITNKAFKERWGLDVLAKKQEKAAKDKAERERKAAAKKAEQDKKDREKLENERRKNEMIAKFENLTAEQKKYVLNQVYKMLKNTPFGELFKNARNQGDVHKNPRFLNQFLEYFEM